MTRQFIVLSGEAGAGKDSVAKVLEEHHGFFMYSLSTSMKAFAGEVFGFTDDQLYGPSRSRNEPDPRWARPCPNCDATRPGNCFTHCCDTCAGTGKLNDNSPRRILQLLGDEWARQMIHPDIWTMAARPHLERLLGAGKRIVINDARFENDRTNLHDWLGADRVDIQTPNKKKDGAAWRLHGSEMSRPSRTNLEYVLTNDEDYPFPNLDVKVQLMINSLYPDAA